MALIGKNRIEEVALGLLISLTENIFFMATLNGKVKLCHIRDFSITKMSYMKVSSD